MAGYLPSAPAFRSYCAPTVERFAGGRIAFPVRVPFSQGRDVVVERRLRHARHPAGKGGMKA